MAKNQDIERLFKANYAVMLRLAVAMVHDRDAAGDVVHGVFESLLDSDSIATVDTPYLLEAVRRLTSRLPVRVSQTRSGIYVEAMQRGLYRYTGRVVGQDGEGVQHATVMLLAPRDSTVLTYAFTDRSGRFAVPCDVRNVILKLSSVGYLTENPQDPRFNGARYVVNFVMIKYEYGGYTKGDAYQKVPDPSGNFTVNSKFSYKKMTYDVSAGCFYEIDHRSRKEEQTNYQFPGGDVSWYLSTDDRRYNHNTEYATLRAVYSDTHTRVLNTIGYQGNGSRLRFVDNNTYTPQVYPNDISKSGLDFRSNSATWYGSYQFFLPHDMTLSVRPTLRYSHHFSGNSYISDNRNIVTDANENAWNGTLSLSGMKKWGRQSMTVSIYGEMADNKLHYVGSDLSRVHNFNDAVGAGISSRLYFGKFWLSPSVTLYYSYKKFEDVRDRQWLPKYYIQLGYNFNKRHRLSLSSEMSHWSVGVAQRSPNIVIRNLFDAVTGNPALKPMLYNSVMGEYEWNVCHELFVSAFCEYRRWTKPITDVYTPVMLNGREMMLKSLTRDGYFETLIYGASASMSLLNRSLSFWVTAYGDYGRRGGKYNYSGNYLRCKAGINYYLKNFYFSGYYDARKKRVTRDSRIYVTPSYYQLSAGWGANGFNVSVTATNFLRSSARALYVEQIYENYSELTREYYWPTTSWGIRLQLSYSFSYGRKVERDNGPGSTGQIDSGILQ